MNNFQEIINRYSGKIKRNSVTGYLAWGGKNFYEINSQKELCLNRDYESFILNEKGEVEIYEIIDRENGLGMTCYRDPEFTIPITYEEIDDEGLEYEEGYFRNYEEGIKKYWGKTLDHYYPHPWYPNKEIKGFEILRELPEVFIGEIIELSYNFYDGLFIKISQNIIYSLEKCLKFCEFFRPIYYD